MNELENAWQALLESRQENAKLEEIIRQKDWQIKGLANDMEQLKASWNKYAQHSYEEFMRLSKHPSPVHQ